MVDHIDVVTANGDLVRCSAFENGDLFWAAFGSGPGFFGVVVRFGLKARPAVKGMYHTTYIFPGTEYDHVFKWYLDIAYVSSYGLGKPILLRSVTETCSSNAGRSSPLSSN